MYILRGCREAVHCVAAVRVAPPLVSEMPSVEVTIFSATVASGFDLVSWKKIMEEDFFFGLDYN